MKKPDLSLRLRTVIAAALIATTGFFVELAPATPIARPAALAPAPAKAAFCATNPTFTGRLTASSSSTTAVSRITSATVYGYISNVDSTWSCTAYNRYDGLAWNTTSSLGTFDWGTLINSTTVSCNWVVGSTDYLKANSTNVCPTSDADKAMAMTLSPQQVYQASTAHTAIGQFSFVHADCGTYYGATTVKTSQSFSTSNASNRPGSNCDPLTIDSTGTSQTVTYDSTPPTISVSAPATGGPVTVPSASYTVAFSASDAVAGFGGTNGWTLQRQIASWSGTACGTFANDSATGNVVTGTVSGSQTSGQSLAVGNCYRWTLGATDQNGNAAAVVTSGSIRTDTSAVLGVSPWLRMESWELGGRDSLAVSPGSGNVVLTHPIVSLPIRGSSTSIDLVSNSQDSGNVGFGPGWRLNVQRRLALNADGTVTFTDLDGSRHTFTNPATVGTVTTYTRPATLYAALVKDTSQSVEFTLTYRDQSRDTFAIAGSEGLLTRAEDRFGNGVTVSYVSGTNRIGSITDTAASPNRTIDFAYDGSNRLISITDWAYVSSGVVQTGAIGSRRATRFFYDGSSNLAGWADPLNTSGSCPTGGSHLTCLTLTGGLVTAIGKTQTVETMSGGVLGSSTRSISTQITYAGADVTAVKDAEQVNAGGSGATFSHPAAGQTKVVRPGTPASETTYALGSVTDAYGRVTSVKRKLGSSQIEQLTVYDTSYPIEPASITENNGALLSTPARTTSYTYVASSFGLVSRLTEPLTVSTNRTTDYTYNSNNDITQKIVALDGSGTTRTITRFCYDASCTTSGNALTMSKQIDDYVDGTAGNGAANVEDVTTTYLYDAYGQRTRATRSNYDAAGNLLDSAATGWTYDDTGDQTSVIANYANGTVTNPGDDITPNATTNARTDLTTAYTYDTAGERVGSADPRRAIEAAKGTSLGADDYIGSSTFDPLGETLTSRLPTTPSVTDCSPTPGCRTTTSVFDELGRAREVTDPAGLVTASTFDRIGNATATYEDTDGAGTSPAQQTTSTTFDAAGRALTAKDRRQVADSTLGATANVFDELGRETSSTSASGSNPDVSSPTVTTYDALDRQLTVTSGSAGVASTTTTTYDLGGRAIATDDEFTCASTTYDYRDLATQVTEGQTAGSCAGSGTRTTTITSDGLGRVTLRAVTLGTGMGDQPESNTYDAAGHRLSTSGTQGGVTTTSSYTVDPLDQTVVETRTDGSTSKTNYDAAGNVTDRCYWKPSITVGACLPADTVSWTNPPSQAGTTGSDARNQRISLISRLGSSSTVATTTYDPANNYQISAFYLPTGSGNEAQDVYTYDTRHRLATTTHQLCTISSGHACSSTVATGYSSYAYDDNSNRTSVMESSTAGVGSATTRNYCYDAVNQLRAEKTAAACTSSSGDETFAYDNAGNRTSATVSGSTRTFTYNTSGQLGSCSNPTCSVSYDPAGRSLTITDNGLTWTYAYDADGKLTSACKSSACAGSGYDRVDWLYDGSGHRTQIKETTAAGVVTTTDLRYEGDTLVQESVAGAVTRTYATDDTGRIVEVCDPDCSSGTVYLVVYNGHGDATGLWRQNADGTLTLANSYTYSTWGTPSTTVASGFSDLKFRFLYVGASDVQWDSSLGLGLLNMHARSYSPNLGRFLQPDPARADGNLYGYAGNSPVTKSDPSGRCLIPVIGWIICGEIAVAGATFAVAGVAWAAHNIGGYLYHHPIRINFGQPQQLVDGKTWEQKQIAKLRLKWPVVRAPKYFWTKYGRRYLDACVYDDWLTAYEYDGIFPIVCYEFKKTSGAAWRYYYSGQALKDQAIREQYPWINIQVIWTY